MKNNRLADENKRWKEGQIIRIEKEQLIRHFDKAVRGTRPFDF